MRTLAVALAVVAVAACGGSNSNSQPDGATPDGAMPGGPDLASAPPSMVCNEPVGAASTTGAQVIGDGTAAKCTEANLRTAIAQGGPITFNCGAAPVTISIGSQLELSKARDTVVDGGGLVTLDGGGATRLFHFDGGDYRKTKTTITLQNLTLANAKATGTPIPPANPPASQGTDTDGGGGAIYLRDGQLVVFHCTFQNDACAPLGPDVAGGAIYGLGALSMIVVGSTFDGCSGANGGAIGALNSTLAIYDSTFTNNRALGHGENYQDPGNPAQEDGDGGNGGAVNLDGGDNGSVTLCGATFRNNQAGALGGALFRTVDNSPQPMIIDLCTFDGNSTLAPVVSGEGSGAGAAYLHNCDLTLSNTTISNNSSPGAGGIQIDGSPIHAVNVTFANNDATKSLGGALFLGGGNSGELLNCTFAGNSASGGSGFFSAAIAGGDAITITNTVFANNTTMDAGSPMTCAFAPFPDGGGDVQWPRNHTVGGAPDDPCTAGVTFGDPLLGALQDNGGATFTMLPGSGSAAIGVGHGCPATDQRGHARPADGCTAGAVEAN